MSQENKLYPFGFIFSDETLGNVPKYYSKRTILNKYDYHFDNVMDVHLYEDEGKFILIHGDFVHVGIDDELNKEELIQSLYYTYFNDYDSFLDTLDFMGGRFVIIIGNDDGISVYPDATNSRSTYYTTDRNVLSSHIFLINDNFKYNRPEGNSRLFNMLLKSARENVRSTVANHQFDLFNKTHTRFFPRGDNKYTALAENEKFDLIERFWKKQLDQYFKHSGKMVFSLTGGGDSRFSLALMKDYMDNVEFFTYASTNGDDNSSYAARILSIDDHIVKQMLEDLNINHKFFYFDEVDKTLTKEENFALSKNTIARHSAFVIPYMKKYYSDLPLNHIRANLLEIGQTFYFKSEYKENNIESSKTAFRNVHKRYLNEGESESVIDDMFDDYVDEMKFGEQTYDYHILDLHYWEIKMGRWHTEMLNTHDIVFNTISPFNHRAMIDITLSFSYEKRRDRYFQYEIVNRNYPVLNFYGLNNKKNLYEQNRKNIFNYNK